MIILQNRTEKKILDARLLAAASFVRKNSNCADIGCDHGKLSVYLSKSGRCKNIIACDVNEIPLEKARNALLKNNCKNAVCRLGNGLEIIKEHEVSDIVIAGLSGVTIAQIIEKAKNFHKKEYNFVLVPASKPDYLRRYLYENGFALLNEKPVLAAGKVYTVMQCQYTGEKTQQSELFYAVGLIKGQTKEAKAYEKKLLSHLKKQRNTALIKEVEQWFTQKI